MANYLELLEVPLSVDIQSVGECIVPADVILGRIVIEPRDNPGIGNFRIVITVASEIVFAGAIPRGRFTIEIDDQQQSCDARKVVLLASPGDNPHEFREALENESISLIIIGSHRPQGWDEEEGDIAREIPPEVKLDPFCATDPDLCNYDDTFVDEWV